MAVWRIDSAHKVDRGNCCPLFISNLIIRLVAIASILAHPSISVADSQQDLDGLTQNFRSECHIDVDPKTSGSALRIRHFGQTASIANLLIGLIASGEKTGTFTSPWIYEGNSNETPIVGGYVIVTDLRGNGRLLLRTTAITTMPFNEISVSETSVDGPAVRPLDVWRKVHWAYFERELSRVNKTPTTDMPVTVEEFEVVCEIGMDQRNQAERSD